jgi:glutathione S-transferase
MRLIGALSSPYTRRVAISLAELGVAFEHESVSVFSDVPGFKAINPVVRAPTIIMEDGSLLMESNIIIEYFDRAAKDRSLWPRQETARRQCLRLLGVAQTACDKTVQLVYERELRPAEKQFSPWAERVAGQVAAACELLEKKIQSTDPWLTQDRLTQAGLTLAVVCTFMEYKIPDLFSCDRYPNLFAFRDEAEALPVFRRWPQPASKGSVTRTALWTQ